MDAPPGQSAPRPARRFCRSWPGGRLLGRNRALAAGCTPPPADRPRPTPEPTDVPSHRWPPTQPPSEQSPACDPPPGRSHPGSAALATLRWSGGPRDPPCLWIHQCRQNILLSSCFPCPVEALPCLIRARRPRQLFGLPHGSGALTSAHPRTFLTSGRSAFRAGSSLDDRFMIQGP